MSELAEWLAGDGVLVHEEEPLVRFPSPRRKGIIRGAKLMFFSGVLMPIFFALSFLVEDPGPLFVPLTIFLAGLSVLLYSRIFIEDISPAKSHQVQQPSRLVSRLGGAALPPAADLGVKSARRQQVRTAELANPPSVTEHTTKLLDRD
jgi:hypothetical protein